MTQRRPVCATCGEELAVIGTKVWYHVSTTSIFCRNRRNEFAAPASVTDTNDLSTYEEGQ